MFSDPLPIVINGVTKNLIKVNQDGYSSEYRLRTTTDELRLFIRNISRKDKARNSIGIDRHTVELTHTVFPVAPATSSVIRKTYTVIENQQGDSLTESMYVSSALYALLSGANITKLLNFES